MKFRREIFLTLIVLCGVVSTLAQTPKQELNEKFWEAVRKGDLAAVTALLDQGADVNAKFRYGSTALFKAAEKGNLEIVKLLLARGADVTVKDTFYGANAISWALQNDHPDVVTVILEKDPSDADDVLMTGAREGKQQLIKIALATGKVKADKLTAALVIATDDKEHPEIRDMLKSAGAVAPPEIAAATLQSYVGKYKDEAGTEITISKTDNRLFALPTGQRPFALIAIDEASFKPLEFDGILVHFKVEAGNATALELKRGQVTTELKRVAETKQP
jgi:ankyrin repeat protein